MQRPKCAVQSQSGGFNRGTLATYDVTRTYRTEASTARVIELNITDTRLSTAQHVAMLDTPK